jgi:hypothetical protein
LLQKEVSIEAEIPHDPDPDLPDFLQKGFQFLIVHIAATSLCISEKLLSVAPSKAMRSLHHHR